MIICPHCLMEIEPGAIGRPKKLKDEEVQKLRLQGLSLAQIAKRFNVTRTAIQYSLKRSEKKRSMM